MFSLKKPIFGKQGHAHQSTKAVLYAQYYNLEGTIFAGHFRLEDSSQIAARQRGLFDFLDLREARHRRKEGTGKAQDDPDQLVGQLDQRKHFAE